MNKIHQKFVVPKNKHLNNPIITHVIDKNMEKSETESKNLDDSEQPIMKSINFNSAEKSAIPYVDDSEQPNINSIDFNSPEKLAIIEDIKKILEKDTGNFLINIREDLNEYKKITDQRIEKLVKLFLSIK
jgi:hypothetical protein